MGLGYMQHYKLEERLVHVNTGEVWTRHFDMVNLAYIDSSIPEGEYNMTLTAQDSLGRGYPPGSTITIHKDSTTPYKAQFFKRQDIVALYSTYTRAMTFEKFCQVSCYGDRPHCLPRPARPRARDRRGGGGAVWSVCAWCVCGGCMSVRGRLVWGGVRCGCSRHGGLPTTQRPRRHVVGLSSGSSNQANRVRKRVDAT